MQDRPSRSMNRVTNLVEINQNGTLRFFRSLRSRECEIKLWRIPTNTIQERYVDLSHQRESDSEISGFQIGRAMISMFVME